MAIGMIVMFWRSLQKVKVDEIPIGVPIGNGSGQIVRGGNGAPGGVVTVDVLNQLIRENPANMTQAVRTWLNRGKANN
jgi:hypothetical protein